MPVAQEQTLMAECVNCGLGLANDDLRQGIMSPSPVFTDMFIRGMQDLSCLDRNSLQSRTEKDIKNLPLSIEQDATTTGTIDNSISMAEPVKKELPDDFTDKSNLLPEELTHGDSTLSEVPSNESQLYFLPVNYNKRNPWRRVSGFHVSGDEVRSATYPARSSVKKLRFAQAKKPLNYLYSYFSMVLIDCDEKSSITVGLTRKDYPSKTAPGKTAGSIGYCSDSGSIFLRDIVQFDGPQFSKGDVIGCGIIYPSHYKRYADLSTDDNSDGMTDVVLTSLLNKRSMDFVCNALNLQAQKSVSSQDYDKDIDGAFGEESEYYNENFVESRTQVEIYFTHNMQVIGKILSHIPIGGFYPTVHVFSPSAIRITVDLNPPTT